MFDALANYPRLSTTGRNYCLGIYPRYHTRLFPDSKLCNETNSVIKDETCSNSIQKIYLTAIRRAENLRAGDNLLIYRTSDGQGAARFRSVVTSACVVQSVVDIGSFLTFEDFRDYCKGCSVFSEVELRKFYKTRKYPIVLKFTYNLSFGKRITNGELQGILGREPDYWGFFEISHAELNRVLDVSKG